MAFVGIPGDPAGTPKITMVTPPAQPWYPWLPVAVAGGAQNARPPAAVVADPYPRVPPATTWAGYTFPLVWEPAAGDWDKP